MKINNKYFDKINTEPFLVQEVSAGTIEFYDLKDYPEIYNSVVGNGRFYFWSINNTDVHKILLEESYYNELKDLYCKRVNEVQLDFFRDINAIRKGIVTKFFTPLAIIILILFGLIYALVPSDQSGLQIGLYAFVLILFIVFNMKLNKKINMDVTNCNVEAVNKIKGILGADKYESLLDKQEAYIEEFYKKQRAELGIEEPEDFVEDEYVEETTSEETQTNNETIEETNLDSKGE
ncbi:MAG: hypothetical protein R3Y05_03225 [bacterium]